jgi:hypothetical protein
MFNPYVNLAAQQMAEVAMQRENPFGPTFYI